MLIQSIKNFLDKCPCLAGYEINTGYLGENENSVSVAAENFEPVITQYVCGDYLKQFVFTLSMRASYGRAHAEDALAVLENTAVWLSEGVLPEMNERQRFQYAEALTEPVLVSNGTDFSKYEMQCRVVYYEKGDSY